MADTRKLPTPVVERWDWQLRGACRDLDSTVFFHPDGERGPQRDARIERAKQVCNGCPVLQQCRRHALSVEEPYGVWGGLSESERKDLLRDPDDVLCMLEDDRRASTDAAVSGDPRLSLGEPAQTAALRPSDCPPCTLGRTGDHRRPTARPRQRWPRLPADVGPCTGLAAVVTTRRAAPST